jgi:hypothetical protein
MPTRTSYARIVNCLALFMMVHSPMNASAEGTSESPLGFTEMPEAKNGEWILKSPYGSGNAWGRPEMIRYLQLVCAEWRRRSPNAPTIRIGDMSKADGAPFPPHRTHTTGLEVDIKTQPENIADVTYRDQQSTLDLAELFYTFGAFNILYGREHSLDGLPIVKVFEGHDTHFHVDVNPANVPGTGDWVFFPRTAMGDEAPSSDSNDARSITLVCDLLGVAARPTGEWQIVPPSGLQRITFQLQDTRNPAARAYTSPPLQPNGTAVSTQVRLGKGRAYRWRLQIVTPNGRRQESCWFLLGTSQTIESKPTLTVEQSRPVEIPLHFTVLTRNPYAGRRTTPQYLRREVETLNKAYAEAHPQCGLSFTFKSVCSAGEVEGAKSALALRIDAQEEYDGESWRSLFNACSNPRIVDPHAINVFIRDEFSKEHGFRSQSCWVKRNSNKPYILLDWERALDAGLLSAVLEYPESVIQNLGQNPRLLKIIEN